MPEKLLIVGSFRGGLGYVRELLTRAGFIVGATFDRQTNVDNIEDRIDRSTAIEVSPYAASFLAHPGLVGHKVVYVLRDPRLVISSLLRIGYPRQLVGPKPSWYELACCSLHDYEKKYGAEGQEADAALSLVHNWLQLAKTLRPDLMTVQLEQGPLAVLQTAVGWPRDKFVPHCPPDVNAGGHIVPLTGLGKNPEEFRQNLEALLVKQGYYEMRTAPRGGSAHYLSVSWHC